MRRKAEEKKEKKGEGEDGEDGEGRRRRRKRKIVADGWANIEGSIRGPKRNIFPL